LQQTFKLGAMDGLCVAELKHVTACLTVSYFAIVYVAMLLVSRNVIYSVGDGVIVNVVENSVEGNGRG
jgi:hypothetical protein